MGSSIATAFDNGIYLGEVPPAHRIALELLGPVFVFRHQRQPLTNHLSRGASYRSHAPYFKVAST